MAISDENYRLYLDSYLSSFLAHAGDQKAVVERARAGGTREMLLLCLGLQHGKAAISPWSKGGVATLFKD